MKKNSKSPTKKEQTSKRTRSQRPVQRETKEVLAELVERLRGKLELKAMPVSPGQVGQQPELRPNFDRLTVGWIWTKGATTAFWDWKERR